MGITLDYGHAHRLLAMAVEWAQSEREVPQEWLVRTTEVAAAPSKTFTVALGTGLLAKATDPRVDALALKAESSVDAYSARTLCHNVLVPASVRFGFGLRATGREPLNNQPFFRYDRIDAMDRVHKNSRSAHAYLVETLQQVNLLDGPGAMAALAAFLRQRIQTAGRQTQVVLDGTPPGLHTLFPVIEAFLAEDVEGGRRAQAYVAAVCDLVFDGVSTSRINDPSRHLPGDVHVVESSGPRLAVEVRYKRVTEMEIVQFFRALSASGVPRGLVAALAPDQPKMDSLPLVRQAWDEGQVLLCIVFSARQLLEQATLWSTKETQLVLADFSKRMLSRLRELDVESATLDRWAAMCGTEYHHTQPSLSASNDPAHDDRLPGM